MIKGAMVAFESAMVVFAATSPLLAVAAVATGVLAVVGAVVALAFAMQRASIVTAEVSDQMTKLADKSRDVANGHRAAATRLAKLASRNRLSNEQMSEAIQLNNTLSKAYGDLGIAFDATNNTIDASPGAFEKLSTAIDSLLQRPIEQAIEEQKRNFRELSNEITNVTDRIKFDPFASEDERISELKALEKRREAVADEIFRMQDELARLRGGSAEPDAAALAAIDASADASIRAQRRVLILRLQMIEDKGGRPGKNSSPTVTSFEHAIRESGLSNQTAARWQVLATPTDDGAARWGGGCPETRLGDRKRIHLAAKRISRRFFPKLASGPPPEGTWTAPSTPWAAWRTSSASGGLGLGDGWMGIVGDAMNSMLQFSMPSRDESLCRMTPVQVASISNELAVSSRRLASLDGGYSLRR